MKRFVASFFAFLFVMVPFARASFLPDDPYYNKQWYLARIGAPGAWEKINSSPDVTIAVIDTGIQIDHPDLKDNIWTNTKEIPGNGIDDDHNGFIDDVHGWDFVDNVPDPSPKFEKGWTETGISHGTMVSGIIAARGNNNKGITGVTWQAKIMPLRALNDQGEGRVSAVIRAIDYAINNGADIINLSFVGFGYSQALQEAVQRAHNAGVIVVAAAGNEQHGGDGYDTDVKPIYPACYDGDNGENLVIGVAATDALDQKAKFSSYGVKCVDIAAPGISFFGTVTYGGNPKQPNEYYDGFWSGTSMAAPVVSGTLALIMEINPQLRPDQVVSILFRSAEDISRLNQAYPNQMGVGRVDADRAVRMAQELLYSHLGRILLAPNLPSDSATSTEDLIVTDKDGALLRSWPLTDKLAPDTAFSSGDVDGDGEDEIIVGSGKGQEPYVNIYGPDGTLRGRFLVYAPSFKGGFSLAVADVNGDGKAEIITGAGEGGGPQVRIFNDKGHLLGQFFAFERSFHGGVNVAAGDIDGVSGAEIIAARGPGEKPEVKIFDRHGNLFGSFFAYEKDFKGGVNVTVGNIDGRADHNRAEIITAPGPGHKAIVKVFDNHAFLKESFAAYRDNWLGGAYITSGDLDNDGRADIITGAMPGAAPHVRAFNGQGQLMESFYAYPQSFNGGVRVGFANFLN